MKIVDIKYKIEFFKTFLAFPERAEEFAGIFHSCNYGEVLGNDYRIVSQLKKVFKEVYSGVNYESIPELEEFPSTSIFAKLKYHREFKEYTAERFGIIDKEGKLIIPFKYDEIKIKSSIYALEVKRDDKYGLIDLKDNTLLPCEFDFIANNYSEGKLLLKRNGKYGYANVIREGEGYEDGYWNLYSYDNSNNCFKYEQADSFSEGLAAVSIKEKWGAINHSDEPIISIKFDQLKSFENGVARVQKDGKWGLISSTEHQVIPLIYDYLSPVSEGVIAARVNDKIGFIDTNNRIVIPFEYDAIINTYLEDGKEFTKIEDFDFEFHEGLACLSKFTEKGIRFGYIDKANNVIHPFIYSHCVKFNIGCAVNTVDDYTIFGHTESKYLLYHNNVKFIESEFYENFDNDENSYMANGSSIYTDSDNDILDAFDGDPDALWNID